MAAVQQAIHQTCKSTADLANHLPTGTVLAFHVLSPVFTHLGHCPAASDRTLTAALLSLCALSCFVLSFTDSFADPATSRVRYGLATPRGLWMIDGLGAAPDEETKKRQLAPLDFLHAFTALVVFAALALLNPNVVECFCPAPSEGVRQVLALLPVGVGVLGSSLLVTFPTPRHGIGFPVTPSHGQ